MKTKSYPIKQISMECAKRAHVKCLAQKCLWKMEEIDHWIEAMGFSYGDVKCDHGVIPNFVSEVIDTLTKIVNED
jgi:hypothetical protein